MEIGDKIRKVRELKGYKQEYVAEKLGMSVTAYGNIERNESSISLERLQEIAEVLEVTVQDILNIPEQFNVHAITNSKNVGFNATFNDNRAGTDEEIQAYKKTIEVLEQEVEYLRKQNLQLMEMLNSKIID
jgi:transcriptional regulator with XRE-family HTH domain